jgi:hypothetical protein
MLFQVTLHAPPKNKNSTGEASAPQTATDLVGRLKAAAAAAGDGPMADGPIADWESSTETAAITPMLEEEVEADKFSCSVVKKFFALNEKKLTVTVTVWKSLCLSCVSSATSKCIFLRKQLFPPTPVCKCNLEISCCCSCICHTFTFYASYIKILMNVVFVIRNPVLILLTKFFNFLIPSCEAFRVIMKYVTFAMVQEGAFVANDDKKHLPVV